MCVCVCVWVSVSVWVYALLCEYVSGVCERVCVCKLVYLCVSVCVQCDRVYESVCVVCGDVYLSIHKGCVCVCPSTVRRRRSREGHGPYIGHESVPTEVINFIIQSPLTQTPRKKS